MTPDTPGTGNWELGTRKRISTLKFIISLPRDTRYSSFQ